MEAVLGVAQGSLQLGELRCGRSGEFTCTWGSTKMAFDEAVLIFLGRWLGSPDAPKSASPRIERLWETLGDAADASEFAAGTAPEYKFYALKFAAQVYNRSPTSANVHGSGLASFTSLAGRMGLSGPFRSVTRVLSFNPPRRRASWPIGRGGV